MIHADTNNTEVARHVLNSDNSFKGKSSHSRVLAASRGRSSPISGIPSTDARTCSGTEETVESEKEEGDHDETHEAKRINAGYGEPDSAFFSDQYEQLPQRSVKLKPLYFQDSRVRRESRRLSRAADFFEEHGVTTSLDDRNSPKRTSAQRRRSFKGPRAPADGGARSLRRSSSMNVDAGVMVARQAVLLGSNGRRGDAQHVSDLADSLMLTMKRAERTADAIFAWYETNMPHNIPDEGDEARKIAIGERKR